MRIGIFVQDLNLDNKIMSCFKKIGFFEYTKLSAYSIDTESKLDALFTDVEGVDTSLPSILFTSKNLSLSINVKSVDVERPLMGILSFLSSHMASKENFFSVPIEKIQSLGTCPCDIYLKLSESKYVKVINRDDPKSEEILLTYVSKSIESLFILSEDYYTAIGPLLSHSFSVEAFKLSPVEESNRFLGELCETARDLGISDTTINSFKEISGGFESMLIKDNELNLVLLKFQKSKGTFLYNHSSLIALVGLEVMKSFSWANSKEKEKFVMAAFLHDLGYTNPKNCLYEDSSIEKFEKLDKSIREDVESHVIGSLNLLLKSKFIPEDVVLMIKQHHAFESYSTFKVSQNQITKNSSLFILAHAFTSKFIRCSLNKAKMIDFLVEDLSHFRGDSFKQITPIFINRITQLLT